MVDSWFLMVAAQRSATDSVSWRDGTAQHSEREGHPLRG